MAKKIDRNIGKIYYVEIGQKHRCFFQHIANDSSQFNNPVIRVFKKRYSFDDSINIDGIVSDEVDFYAHTFSNMCPEIQKWHEIGKSRELGFDKLKEVLFASTTRMEFINGEYRRNKKPLDNWHVWHIDEEPHNAGRLPESMSEIVERGDSLKFQIIKSRMEYGYYRDSSIEYNFIKRRAYPLVDSYTKRMVCGNGSYFHFKGEDAVAQLVVRNGVRTKLSLETPFANGHRLREEKFWETNWGYYDFITKEEFEAVWNA